MDEEIKKISQERKLLQEQIEELKRAQEKLSYEISNLERREEEWEEENRILMGRINQWEQEINDLEDKIIEVKELKNSREEELSEVKKERTSFLEEGKEIREKLGRLKIEKEEIGRTNEETFSLIREKELSLKSLESKMENLRSQIYSLYEVDITTVKMEDLSHVEEDLDSLKERLRKIGPVNLIAIDEEKEIKERYEFYIQQVEDAENSLQELEESLKILEQEARKKFMETFYQVRREFSRTFQEIFEGGEADLKLTNDEKFEDKGVEIFAQPPGKKLTHLSLLSQGERALVAIALLFSFFRIKPSPFCMLDEVDAPLDDQNVEKFVSFLSSMKEKLQFLIISHNKKTLAKADALFGITMEEPGISRVISVSFQEAERISES